MLGEADVSPNDGLLQTIDPIKDVPQGTLNLTHDVVVETTLPTPVVRTFLGGRVGDAIDGALIPERVRFEPFTEACESGT